MGCEDFPWPPAADGGYAPDGYGWAFGLMIALQAAGLSWFLAHRRGEG